MMRLFKEPLVHFLVLGGALFWWYAQVNEGEPAEDGESLEVAGPVREFSKDIVITPSRIESIQQQFQKVWQRDPTPAEREGLIEAFVREEILYREALALGLDQDDSVVRRRLRQKMEFVSEDLIVLDPTEEELLTYLEENGGRYRKESTYSFRQVFLKLGGGESLWKERADELLAHLSTQGAAADLSTLGDSLMLAQEHADAMKRDVVRGFGEAFAKALETMPLNVWHGPIRSGYGAHLVFLSDRQEGQLPELAEVRDAVERDWSAEKRRESNDALYQKWREGYTVTIEERQDDGAVDTP